MAYRRFCRRRRFWPSGKLESGLNEKLNEDQLEDHFEDWLGDLLPRVKIILSGSHPFLARKLIPHQHDDHDHAPIETSQCESEGCNAGAKHERDITRLGTANSFTTVISILLSTSGIMGLWISWETFAKFSGCKMVQTDHISTHVLIRQNVLRRLDKKKEFNV